MIQCMQLESRGVFRGAAGECMRSAALKFIEKMCQSMLPISGHATLGNNYTATLVDRD